ncbi:TPA: DUF3265 domain-containing protein [Vibrio parahaemolyticus]|nr:DUF3265 domain-containing protein [Vibrio parahaemolyticus]MCC3811009.1 DUF3265 domain-containing protein [Vibrio parahaemolyticus]HBC3540497.1 DUF3265 domain-containing protein [Vibrio parahaemolyticus]HBC3816274.1 DUF3265 domain-containing protein [Vibrio parahaemolyticus]HBC3950905.1 DUF3265 domain-containing protein [Vibrio parahaemolyticus]
MVSSLKNKHKKQFKRDSARVAFLVCGGFGVEVPCGSLVIACFTPLLGVICKRSI